MCTNINAGIVIEQFNEREYLNAVDKIEAGVQFNAAAIRKGAEEFYALEKAIEKYNQIYNSILGH
ncbi:MAG: hypothetical protein WDM90_08445 [Ferruginibacter sp.]